MSLEKEVISLSDKLFSGAVAGIVGTTLQDYNQDYTNHQGNFPGSMIIIRSSYHPSRISCFRIVIAEEGFRGLYRGLLANLIGVTPEKAIKLAVNDLGRNYWSVRLGVNSMDLPPIHGMTCGALAGFCQVIATNPMEIVKIQMQLAAKESSQHTTVVSVVKRLGIRGLYRGTISTLCRDVPFSILFFQSFASIRGLLSKDHSSTSSPPILAVLTSGMISGGLSAIVATPMDVVKTRLQSVGGQSRSMANVYRDVYVHEGVRGFYKGATQRAMIVAPLFSVSLLVYELQQHYLKIYSLM